MLLLAIDIGGTFTDLIAFDGDSNSVGHAKALTTPENLVKGVLDCVAKSGLKLEQVQRLIHGSTIAINTLIERHGAKTALLVTKGTRDVYAIGRGNRPDAYNLRFQRPRPLVPRQWTFEIDERMRANGSKLVPINEAQIAQVAHVLKENGFNSVAVCFLHSYANTEHEEAAGKVLSRELGGTYVSLSHEIMREYREYERISTTVVNAYVGPKVSGYVRNLDTDLRDAGFGGELSIMQSNGGIMAPSIAARRPVMMMESGPVGGIIAAAEIAKGLGFPNVISFDMGGTTAKASLVRQSTPAMAEGYFVGGYEAGDPVMIPVVNVVEIGTGGGSIAWVDKVGALKVGPRSAGALPGPICYRRGGERPTITDANVVLGRIGVDEFLGGDMTLDGAAALQGINEQIGRPLGLSVHSAARAIIDIAVAKMSLAVRQVSVQQGHDPRDFALVASGGAGPLHAVAVARDLGLPIVIVPSFPSHFSALGMLLADERHDLVRTFLAPLDRADFELIRTISEELADEARRITRRSGAELSLSFDLRYVGQEFSLSVPVTREQIEQGQRDDIRSAFDAVHEQRYAHHASDEPVEIINIRLVTRVSGSKPVFPSPQGVAVAPRIRHVLFGDGAALKTPVYQRQDLQAQTRIEGPALVQEYGTTTVIAPGDVCGVARTGELIIELGA